MVWEANPAFKGQALDPAVGEQQRCTAGEMRKKGHDHLCKGS